MATIYRFIVEQGKGKGGLGGGKTKKKSTAKAITPLSLLTDGVGGGVNNNRSMRAFNYLGNKVFPGYEKAVRISKASLGLVKLKETENGGYQFAGLSSSAIAIIIVLIVQALTYFQKKDIERKTKENMANYKKLETGQSAIHGDFDVSTNFFNGKVSYNENK